MTKQQATQIARQVTIDLDLKPVLTGFQVLAIADPDTARGISTSLLPPLRAYDDEWAATIESRILQEVEN